MIKDGVIYPSLEENILLLNDFREDVLDGLLTMYLYGGGNIKGIVSTVDALPATGENLGDGYLVGTDPYDLYIWATKDGNAASWVPLGKFPAKGEQGTRGDRGSIIINQASDPKNAPDRSGDYWINTVTGDWFMSLKNTTASGGYYWSKRFNLKGKKGDRGPQGYQGVPGPVGPQGPVGPAGATYTPMDLDLNTGISSVTYNTTNGISLTTQGTIKSNTGTNQVVVDYKIPIVAGDGISINKKANADKIEVKVDSSRSITATGFVASENGASVSLYSDNIQYYDYEGNQYMLFLPSKDGTLTTDNSFKTIFGYQSVVGNGSIDLYQHNICFTSTDPNKILKIRFIVMSSNKLEVTSLADLKTLLGNTFTYPVNGAYATGNSTIYEITETGFKAGVQDYPLYDHAENYPAGTWTDTVTTV